MENYRRISCWRRIEIPAPGLTRTAEITKAAGRTFCTATGTSSGGSRRYAALITTTSTSTATTRSARPQVRSVPPTTCWCRRRIGDWFSARRNRVLAGPHDLKELLEAAGTEEFRHGRRETADGEPAACLADFVADIDEQSQTGAVEVFHLGQVQHPC